MSRSSSIPTILTAASTRRADLLELHASVSRSAAAVLIVDEAFADFDGVDESLAPVLPEKAARSSCARSARAYGLPGLRLGFAIASPDIA